MDGYVFVEDPGRELMSGEMIDVIIDGAEGYDLTGCPVE